MSRAYGIGARHFFITESPIRHGWLLCEQGKNSIYSVKSLTKCGRNPKRGKL